MKILYFFGTLLLVSLISTNSLQATCNFDQIEVTTGLPFGVLVTWQTSDESGSSNFQLERSLDGEHWQNIGAVSAQGTDHAPSKYWQIDFLPLSDQSYYRVKELDRAGNFGYSEVVSCMLSAKPTISVTRISEVVTTNTVDLTLEVHNPTNLTYWLSSGPEKIQATGSWYLPNGTSKQTVDMSTLAAGIYFLQILDETQQTIAFLTFKKVDEPLDGEQRTTVSKN